MNYIQIILATIFVVCLSVSISAQTVRPVDKYENDVRVYDSKNDMLLKIKQNIERKQGDNPEGEQDDSEIESGKQNPGSKDTPTTDKQSKIILPKKDN